MAGWRSYLGIFLRPFGWTGEAAPTNPEPICVHTTAFGRSIVADATCGPSVVTGGLLLGRSLTIDSVSGASVAVRISYIGPSRTLDKTGGCPC